MTNLTLNGTVIEACFFSNIHLMFLSNLESLSKKNTISDLYLKGLRLYDLRYVNGHIGIKV